MRKSILLTFISCLSIYLHSSGQAFVEYNDLIEIVETVEVVKNEPVIITGHNPVALNDGYLIAVDNVILYLRQLKELGLIGDWYKKAVVIRNISYDNQSIEGIYTNNAIDIDGVITTKRRNKKKMNLIRNEDILTYGYMRPPKSVDVYGKVGKQGVVIIRTKDYKE